MTSRRVTILFAINTLARGGAERQLVELVRGLDATRFSSSVACIVSGGPLEAELVTAAIPVAVFDIRSPWGLAQLIRHTNKISPDIVQAFLFGSNVVGALVATIVRVPFVITSRRSFGFFKDRRPHYNLLQALTNRFTDIVVANSEEVRKDTIRRELLDPAKIRVIPNGVDLARFAERGDIASTRARIMGRETTGPLVVVVANLIEYKGLNYFVDAWREVVRRKPTAKAVILGEGPERRDLEAQSADIAPNIAFLGSRDDVPAILGACDLVVQSSIHEGLPNAILEAMAAARPVVATAVGGTVEALIHERTGVLVPPRDSRALTDGIVRLLDSPELAHDYGRAGRERVEAEFSVERMVARYTDLYTSLVADP